MLSEPSLSYFLISKRYAITEDAGQPLFKEAYVPVFVFICRHTQTETATSNFSTLPLQDALRALVAISNGRKMRPLSRGVMCLFFMDISEEQKDSLRFKVFAWLKESGEHPYISRIIKVLARTIYIWANFA